MSTPVTIQKEDEMNWEMFVKEFVAEIDYDRAKNLEAETAEVPEEAEADLAGLVEIAKRLVKECLCPPLLKNPRINP